MMVTVPTKLPPMFSATLPNTPHRFSRKKHDPGYPRNAVDYVLSEAGLSLSGVDYVAFYDKPFLKFERLLETYVAYAPRGLRSFSMSMPVWLREKLFQKDMLFKELKQHDESFTDVSKMLFSEHHYSHAASAFFPTGTILSFPPFPRTRINRCIKSTSRTFNPASSDTRMPQE